MVRPETNGNPTRQRAILAVAIVVVLTAWFVLDVGPRGRIVPGKVDAHRTDFTVFTEAGAAFFDGRDPYAVTNPRGWFYLYPPLFALMAAPISGLDSVTQVLVWYVASLAMGFGCFIEARRLWTILQVNRTDESPEVPSTWIVSCAVMAIVLPTLECLQRGQMGIALLYAMLLGYRLILGGTGRLAIVLGGIALAWAATVKLVPALPVVFLLVESGWLAIGPRRSRGELARATTLGLAVVVGVGLFLVLIPAATLGWDANLKHLTRWSGKVVTNADPGGESGFSIDTSTNQSLSNAVHSLIDDLNGPHPDDPTIGRARNADERRWVIDRATARRRRADVMAHRLARAGQVLFLALIFAIAGLSRTDDPSGRAVGFGLACLGMMMVSPVAWTHYYMMAFPAYLAVPLWLARRWRPTAARVLAIIPAVLVWAHYLGKRPLGSIGLLGWGMAGWFLAVASLVGFARLSERRNRRDSVGWHWPTTNSGGMLGQSHPTESIVRSGKKSPVRSRRPLMTVAGKNGFGPSCEGLASVEAIHAKPAPAGDARSLADHQRGKIG